jgi:hypothetical protein
MAKMNDIKIKIDEFFTHTRVRICNNFKCLNYDEKIGNCNLKTVLINEFGVCDNINTPNDVQ